MKAKIALLKDVKSLGKSGDIVEVKDGYARHLISEGAATVANQGAIQSLKDRKSSAKYAENVEREKSKRILEILNGKEVQIEVSAGDNGKLHGSVTSSDISEALNDQFSVSVQKNKIRIVDNVDESENRIHAFGMHDVSINLFPKIVANIKVNVIQKNI